MPRWPFAAPAMPSTLSRLITMSATMMVLTAAQKCCVSPSSPPSSSGSSSLMPIQISSTLPTTWIHGSVISIAAHAVRMVISTTMPPVPTMNALRWWRGDSAAAGQRDHDRVVAAQHDVDDGDLEQRGPDLGIAQRGEHCVLLR